MDSVNAERNPINKLLGSCVNLCRTQDITFFRGRGDSTFMKINSIYLLTICIYFQTALAAFQI